MTLKAAAKEIIDALEEYSSLSLPIDQKKLGKAEYSIKSPTVVYATMDEVNAAAKRLIAAKDALQVAL